MQTFTWWINDPLIKGSGNPTDEDLAQLRAEGFTVAVSLLEEKNSRRDTTSNPQKPPVGPFTQSRSKKVALNR